MSRAQSNFIEIATFFSEFVDLYPRTFPRLHFKMAADGRVTHLNIRRIVRLFVQLGILFFRTKSSGVE